jgi:hypothetical protein
VAVAVKFLRQFAAVLLAVAVIVGLGLLWAHLSGGGTGAGGELIRGPSPEAVQRLRHLKGGPTGLVRIGQNYPGRPSVGLSHLGDIHNLIQTCEIEAAAAAVVITVSAIRLRRRRARRAAAEGQA